MHIRWRISLAFAAYQLVSSGCQRAEIDLNDLISDAGIAGTIGGVCSGGTAASDPGKAGRAAGGGHDSSDAGGVGGVDDSSQAGGGAGGVAGAAGDAGELAGNGGDDARDTLAPRVLSITPGNGERGVRNDTKIIVRFSEPMDREQTALGVVLEGIAVGTSWDEMGTELSLTPLKQLAYATGADPAFVDPIAYSVSVNRSAKDVAGNALDADYGATFYTSRELSTRLHQYDALCGYAIASDNPRDSTGFADPHAGDAMDETMKGFVTFQLSGLPPETQAVTSAMLTVDQNQVTGDPYQMGSMTVEHAAFSEVGFVLGAPAKTSFGALFNDATMKTASLDVAAAVRSELAERVGDAGFVQFRFAFASANNPNGVTDEVRLRPIRLDVSYLVP